jgi:hypothetical protein
MCPYIKNLNHIEKQKTKPLNYVNYEFFYFANN